IPKRVWRKVPGTQRAYHLATQAFLETIDTPHRVTFVKDIWCTPEIVDRTSFCLGTSHCLPLQEIRRHLFAMRSARHPIDIIGTTCEVKNKNGRDRFIVDFGDERLSIGYFIPQGCSARSGNCRLRAGDRSLYTRHEG